MEWESENEFTQFGKEQLYKRLRREPSTTYSSYLHDDTLPALFFGDLANAPVVTLGIYPSKITVGDLLPSLSRLGVSSREILSTSQCELVLGAMSDYFTQQGSRRKYFANLDSFLAKTGYMYHRRLAAHINLVQEHIFSTWDELEKEDTNAADNLRREDFPFAHWLIESFPIKVIICDGKLASDNIRALARSRTILANGKEALGKGPQKHFHWWIEQATISDRNVLLMGWNYVSSRSNVKNISWGSLGNQLQNHITQLQLLPPQPSYDREMHLYREQRFRQSLDF